MDLEGRHRRPVVVRNTESLLLNSAFRTTYVKNRVSFEFDWEAEGCWVGNV